MTGWDRVEDPASPAVGDYWYRADLRCFSIFDGIGVIRLAFRKRVC